MTRKGHKHTPESIQKLIMARGGGPVPRFWNMVNKEGASILATRCWEWKGGLNETGHPRFWVNRKLVGAHRFSYELHHGPMPEGKLACHHCDNAKCVNPDHLYAGDNFTNRKDSLLRDRLGGNRLKVAKVIEIKKRLASGEDHRQVARDLGVSENIAYFIKQGKTWSHVKVAAS